MDDKKQFANWEYEKETSLLNGMTDWIDDVDIKDGEHLPYDLQADPEKVMAYIVSFQSYVAHVSSAVCNYLNHLDGVKSKEDAV